MTPITLLKSPLKDITKLNELRKEINIEKKAFDLGEITEEVYNKRKRLNRTNMATVGLPLATSGIMILLFGSSECYDAFQSGIPLTELIGNNLDFISEVATKSFENNPLENTSFINELMNSNYDTVKDYVSYLGTGIKSLFSSLSEHYLNSAYLLATAGAYGVAKAAVKALGFVSGATKEMEKYRSYDHEQTKMNILRKHFHDPVFDNLNNEELFSMSLSFNEVLHANYKNKKKILKATIKGLDKLDHILRIGRKALNKSNNDQNQLMTSVFNFLEKDINEEKLNKSLMKYGISGDEFKAVAATEDGLLSANIKYDYIFGLNKRAIISAYNRKMKDDMLLSFSLRLESYTRGETSMSDSDFEEDINKFDKFIQLYSKENKILKREKLPEDLRVVNKIIKMIKRKQPQTESEVKSFKENANYIDFLRKHASHMIEDRGEKQVFLNNYSFITYYEAERERLAKLDVVNVRLKENTDAMCRNSNLRNRAEFAKKQAKTLELQEKAIELDDIFFDNNSLIGEKKSTPVENIFKPETEKISTVFKDKKIGYEVAVRNFLTEKEQLMLLKGDALKEKGIDLKDAEKALRLDGMLDVNKKDESELLDRSEFKRMKKRFKR